MEKGKPTKEKRFILIISTVFLFVLGILFIFPIKYPVKLSEIGKIETDKELYICKIIETTGPEWLLVGDKNGVFTKDSELVLLVGNVPDKELSKIMIYGSSNKYLIRGTEIGKLTENIWSYNEEKYRVIWVEKWDILEKVDRSRTLVFFLPWPYLTYFDFRH